MCGYIPSPGTAGPPPGNFIQPARGHTHLGQRLALIASAVLVILARLGMNSPQESRYGAALANGICGEYTETDLSGVYHSGRLQQDSVANGVRVSRPSVYFPPGI
ncbi:hypothetical protein NUW54_g3801 [Trametes sanguinea]|uniref:Uncharacterized protein n=1 Tax=Trametes sanguinea TaxID=158606 RepID=A0ACC1Q2U4_9APHY|nr:hypothetical protein NUW54_g3801 [Trametes sanguinea]